MRSEASQYFVAQLGDATAEVEARLAQWGEGCVKHRFVRDERNRAALYFARAEGRTVRQMQSLIRTLTARWGVPLGQLGAGWLRALTLDEFRANVPDGANEGAEGRSKSEAAEPPPAGVGEATVRSYLYYGAARRFRCIYNGTARRFRRAFTCTPCGTEGGGMLS